MFMSTVSIYDIANHVWYEQETTGAPGALAQGCAVVATAQDGSSHNIYWYGGFDGLYQTEPFSDDVWVLSIPSFTWVRVFSGTASHARAGHRCTKPYPDQMFVIGGYRSLSGEQPQCLDGGMIQIFNLSSTEWIYSYDPSIWSNYAVPEVIFQLIGGTATGSATQSVPSPSGFSNATMTALFNSPYNTSKITNWYPYATSNTLSSPARPPLDKSGIPRYLAPILGVVLSLILVLLAVTIRIWRRNRLSKNGSIIPSDITDDSRSQCQGMSPDAAEMEAGLPPEMPCTIISLPVELPDNYSDHKTVTPEDEFVSPLTPGEIMLLGEHRTYI